MNWESFYLVCFFVGLILSALSFFSGAFHLHLPARFHLPHSLSGGLHRVGHVGHAASGARGASDIPFFNVSSVMAFLCWFGGMGYLLTHYGKLWATVAFALSVLFGLGGAAIVFWFLVRVLLRHESALAEEDFEMVGVIGVLSSPIRAGNGNGEMLFLQQGTRRVCCVRSQDASAIEKSAEVVVTRYEDGIAYVRPWTEFAEEHRIPVADVTNGKAVKQ